MCLRVWRRSISYSSGTWHSSCKHCSWLWADRTAAGTISRRCPANSSAKLASTCLALWKFIRIIYKEVFLYPHLNYFQWVNKLSLLTRGFWLKWKNPERILCRQKFENNNIFFCEKWLRQEMCFCIKWTSTKENLDKM
jgi:hypothetical protein